MSQQNEEWTWKQYYWFTTAMTGWIIGFIHFVSTTPFKASFAYYWGLLSEPFQFVGAFVYIGLYLYVVILTWHWNPRY